MNKLKLLLAGISFLAVSLLPGLASADVNDFVITSFSSDQTLTRNDPQGELHIVEKFKIKYNDYNHGFLRAIPDRYKKHALLIKVNKVSSDSGAPASYTKYSSNGNTVLKIGDPDRTVTGAQSYTVDYTVQNVISFYPDHDELYWDVNGEQWSQAFEKVSVTVHLPDGIKLYKTPQCFAGTAGYSLQSCTIVTKNNTISAKADYPLYGYQTLTYVAGFQPGYFSHYSPLDWFSEYGKQVVGFAIPFIVIAGGSFWLWFRRGRDSKGTGIIVPQYDAPDQLKPLEVGCLIDFKVDNRDITATIISLAVRRYIKILEVNEKKILKDKKVYKLELLNNDTTTLDDHEEKLINALFPGKKVGDISELSKNKSSLYNAATDLRSDIKEELEIQGYFKSKLNAKTLNRSLTLRNTLALVGLGVVGFALYLICGISVPVGFGIAVLFSLPFWIAMKARTSKGVIAKEHIQGLKLYLTTAEKTRLEKMQSPDAPYAPKSAAPEKTVELFEKLLPYAIVLQVENEWSKQFESLYTSPPDWYSGNWNTFNSYYLASSISSGVGSAVNTSFSAPSSSGSSGFSGGFSGGGGGGGGGGGW
jgi:uncharacterized membrane protein